MELKSMKLAKDDQAEEMAMSKPDYPYGLCLSLDDETLEMLGLTGLPNVGQVLMLQAKVEVVAVRQERDSSEEDGQRRSLTLQITDMGISPEAKGKSSNPAKALYKE